MATPGGPAGTGRVAVFRTPAGWRVTDLEVVNGASDSADDLLSALVLADLLSADVAPGHVTPPARPGRPTGEVDEIARLRLAVHQLEHALAARVVVEQAIGVLAERRGVRTREAFESLRRAARAQGRKVHELSREVVASVNDASVTLPGGLRRRR